MPKRILIIGILFFLFGLPEIWHTISHSINSSPKRLMLSSNLLFTLPPLIVGIGLILGKTWSQKWANGLIILGYLGCLLMIIFPTASTVRLSGDQDLTGVSALLAKVLLISILALIHWLLYTHKSDEYFNPQKNLNI